MERIQLVAVKRGASPAGDREIECGTVTVNDAYAARWGSVDAPMGGKKQSGLGRRHGREGFLKYTSSKTIATHRVRALNDSPDWMSYEAFADRMSTVLSVMERIPGFR